MHRPQPLSLLWPEGIRRPQSYTPLDPQCVRDLELERTLAAFTDHRPGGAIVREVLLNLSTDAAVIAYRQDIFADLWSSPEFTRQLEALLPDLGALEATYTSTDRRRSVLQEVTWR